MKISVSVTVEIDPEAWVRTFGCARSEVREDVKEYVRNVVASMAVLDEVGVRRTD